MGGTPYSSPLCGGAMTRPFDMTQTLGKQQAKTRTCVMAWKALMEQVQADLPYKAFPAADGVVERSYCTQSGLLASGSCPSTAVGYYRADDLPDAAIIPTVRQLSPANPSRLSRTPLASTPTEAKIVLFGTSGCRFGALKGYFTAQNWII